MKRWRTVSRAVATWYKEWSPWLALIFGGMVIGFLAAKLSTGARAFLSDSVTTQWAAAIATFSATVAALFVAGQSAKQARERDFLSGKMLTVRLYALIHVVDASLQMARRELALPHTTTGTLKPHYAAAQTVLQAIDHACIYHFDRQLAAHLIELKGRLEAIDFVCGQPPPDEVAALTLIRATGGDFEELVKNIIELAKQTYAEVVTSALPVTKKLPTG